MSIVLRRERPDDHPHVEELARRAFWDLYRPGAHEHVLVRLLRHDRAFVPDLARVAEVDGRLAGAVFHARGRVATDTGDVEVLSSGPLFVAPALQRTGVGTALLRATLDQAAALGFRATFLYGDPDYYARFGFVPASRHGILTAAGASFDAFQALELRPGGLDGVRGRFHEPACFAAAEAAAKADLTLPAAD